MTGYWRGNIDESTILAEYLVNSKSPVHIILHPIIAGELECLL